MTGRPSKGNAMLSSLSLLMLLAVQTVDPAATPASVAAVAPEAVQPAASGKLCYARRIIQKDQPPFDFQLILPAGKASLATEKGYAPVACSNDATRLRIFRDKMCEMGAKDDAVQARTIAVLGIDPRAMCAAAKELKDADGGQ